MGKKVLKIVGILALTAALLFTLCIGLGIYVILGSDSKDTSDIGYYQVLSGETEGSDMIPVLGTEFDMPCPFDLPRLSELEPCEDFRFNYTAIRHGIFQSHAYILIVTYNEADYGQRKTELENEYVYLTDTFWGGGEAENHSPEFDLDGFGFRAVQKGEEDRSDVKYMFFVGASDERQEIAYIYYHDQDLDYIDYSLGEFLKDETGWNKVV